MVKPTSSILSAVAFTIVLATMGCGGKPAAKSTTTTSTQTSTQQDTGESTKSEVKETRTEQPDGSQEVKRTETTKQVTPPPAPPAPAH